MTVAQDTDGPRRRRDPPISSARSSRSSRSSRPRVAVAAARAAILLALTTCVLLAWPRTAQAWIYPEHADIADAAIHRLSPGAQAFYRELWEAAHAPRACAEPASGDQGLAPRCLDFAAWSAVAGDHSCSPRELVDDVLTSRWILDVARVAAEAKANLARAHGEREILDTWASSDLGFERADAEYSARAVTNHAHFLSARATNDFAAYAETCIAPRADVNAFGLVVMYQVGALRLALAWNGTEAAGRPALAREILATEAFALHFLEDSLSAGHATGTWGGAASRKGTHDYYCANGFDTATWRRQAATLFGDAHMRPADRERTANAVAASLAQLYEVTRAGTPLATEATRVSWSQARRATSFDSCHEREMAAGGLDRATLALVSEVMLDTPYPGQVETGAPLPRFTAELGPFVGLYSGARIAAAANGYASSGIRPRPVGSLDIGVRFGVGLEHLVGA